MGVAFHQYKLFFPAKSLLSRRMSMSQEELEEFVEGYVHVNTEESLMMQTLFLDCELYWTRKQRPYYNIYPCVIEMLKDASLNLPLSALKLPIPVLSIHFPQGNEIKTALVLDLQSCKLKGPGNQPSFLLHWDFGRERMSILVYRSSDEMTIEELLQTQPHRFESAVKEHHSHIEFLLRILTGLSILASDAEFVQPVVLSRDWDKFINGTEAEKQALVERAVRKSHQRGFEVGRLIQDEYDSHVVSPHIRRPHLALYWTGQGRTIPRLQLRKGCVVRHKDLLELPTGYLGPVSSEEGAN